MYGKDPEVRQMEKYRQSNAFTSKAVYYKKSIDRNRGRAKFVGMIYLLAIIALAAAACFPLLVQSNTYVGVYGKKAFWRAFTLKSLKAYGSEAGFLRLLTAFLYALMLLIVAMNVLRALTKINWLFKRRASKIYGFNRNVYAMEDLGKIFSDSYAAILIFYLLIAVCTGKAAINPLALIVVGGGFLVHLFAGIKGAKTGYYDLEDGEIIEQKRLIGRAAPFIRNLLQLLSVYAIIFCFFCVSKLSATIAPALEKGGVSDILLAKPIGLIPLGLQALTLLWLLVLIKHATATTEYNINGVEGRGMKVFRVFSFFTFLTAGATVVCRLVFGEATYTAIAGGWEIKLVRSIDFGSLIIAGIALFMFIFEIAMRKHPRIPEVIEQILDDEAPVVSGGYPHPDSPYANEPEAEEEDVYEEEEPNDWIEVNCPSCNKLVQVSDSAPYHRCPSCGTVFRVNKTTDKVEF